MKCLLLAALLFTGPTLRGTEPVQNVQPLAAGPPDHTKLLVVRDGTGNDRPVQTREDWTRRVAQIRANMQLVMGALPDRAGDPPLRLEVVSDEQTPRYLRRKVRFTADPGGEVPAWLLIPNRVLPNGKTPAMLCLHQTTTIGKDEPAGLGGEPSLHYAHELAERGYVCLVPDYPSFGEYSCDFKATDTLYASGSMKAIHDNMRGIDVLESLPQVSKDRIGVIGHSLGGHNALFTAVFDERIKAVVTSCGFTSFHEYYRGNLRGWTSARYMPRIATLYESDPDKVPFDFYEILGSLAPRPVFSNSPLHDSNFDIGGVRKVFAAAEGVYALYGAQEKLTLLTPDCGHAFPDREREAAYAWLDRMLK